MHILYTFHTPISSYTLCSNFTSQHTLHTLRAHITLPHSSTVTKQSRKMSSRRSRSSRQSGGGTSRITDAQINDLISKLQQLLPELQNTRRSSDKKSASRVLQETCNYIRSLHREVDDLSDRLSQLLENTDNTQASLIRSLLMQQ